MLLYHKPTPLTTSSLLLTCFGFGFEEKQRWDVMNHRTLSQEAAITLPNVALPLRLFMDPSNFTLLPIVALCLAANGILHYLDPYAVATP